jgi:curved DNA-binding protein CbpA
VTYSAEVRGVDLSESGLGIESGNTLALGSVVYVEARDRSLAGNCIVKHCTRRGSKFHIGLEFSAESMSRAWTPGADARGGDAADAAIDYYEVLQISPTAEAETVHRVFRIMAARFHPDNPETGSVEEFIRLKQAYSVLSDADRRAEYDIGRQTRESGPMPIFELKDFVTGVEAEGNRRLGVLSLLYNQRRADPEHPGISLLDLEKRMAFPREYLTFTTWYLRSKDLVTVGDSSEYALTAAGADYVESNAPRSEILSRLLQPGGRFQTASGPGHDKKQRAPRPGQKFLLGSGSPPKAN